MSYRVVSFTMAQVRQGALGFQRELSAIAARASRDQGVFGEPVRPGRTPPFQRSVWGRYRLLLQRRGMSGMRAPGLDLQFVGEISDDELPRRRTLVVGIPERSGGGRVTVCRLSSPSYASCVTCRIWACRLSCVSFASFVSFDSFASFVALSPSEDEDDGAEPAPFFG